MRSGRTKRFRELRTLVIIVFAIAPQFVLRTEARHYLKPYMLILAGIPGTPWREWSVLSLGGFSFLAAVSVLAWLAVAYFFARWQFAKSLEEDETLSLSPSPSRAGTRKPGLLEGLWSLPNQITRDPMAVLLEKEFRSLLRMPRFRVIFGLACIFSVLVFIPLVLNGSRVGFVANNFLPIVNVYGLLIMGEVLIFNVFGFDRKATQIYFVTTTPFDTVLKAKNLVALFFIVVQSCAVILVAALLRIRVTPIDVANALGTALVIALFLISAGNLTSVHLPRPTDPNQTFRRQTGGKLQFWLMASFIGLSVPVGFAFLARWAFDSEWAYLGVLLADLIVGWIVYRLSLESAVHRALQHTEDLVDRLSKGGDPIGT
jgi:ABC-2 type transport system permease protein